MKKCLKVVFTSTYPAGFLRSFVQKQARDLDLEGTAQVLSTEEKTVVLVCGPKDDVDTFVDALHEGTAKTKLEAIEVEPFIKVKDYRGIFRVIE